MTASMSDHPLTDESPSGGLRRRSFLGYVIGGTTLIAAADIALAGPPASALPSAPSIPEVYDLNDFLTDAARPTANLITVTINSDGTASFALPRSENGQGIVTSSAMIIAEELEMPLDRVRVTLADARPELLFNQLTGGSNTTISTYTPIRVAAAVAKLALLEAAAIVLGDTVGSLIAKGGVVQGPSGSVSYADLAPAAAAKVTRGVEVQLKDPQDYRVVGVATGRSDARDAVTGAKQYTTDLQVADALPTMVCRAPTLNGTPRTLRNKAVVLAMPGVTDVAVVDTGIAVRAATFGQCIDAVRVVDAEWNPGSVEGLSDEDIVRELRSAQVPVPRLAISIPLVAKTITTDTVFYFRSNSSMDTNSAVADVRADRAEVWSGLKSPGTAQAAIAQAVGLPLDKVTVHVMQGGGSFGRRLFFDAALEAAKISKAMGKPVKLMWHRADDARVGRTHPMCTSRVQAVVNPLTKEVLAMTQLHTSIETDYRHGLGDLITANATKIPPGVGNFVGFSQTVFGLTQEIPYNLGAVVQSLTEPDGSPGLATEPRFNTSSMRNIYSPDVRTANELTIDKIAAALGMDPYQFRLKNVRVDIVREVLQKVAEVGQWGRTMPAGTAQGIAIHKEYKGASACLVEIDTRPQTVNRKVAGSPEYVTGPRVTKVTYAINAGLVINPRGLEAQMQGRINDGIAQALTSSMHLKNGHFVEASWDNYFYTRQWNHAPEVEVIIMPSDSAQPGGGGEAGVAASMAAVACAYARATGTTPTYFPINHKAPRPFVTKPYVPPIPASPSDGLTLTS
ncbi:MAG: molybdopterin-dependent oxidoreductase [Nocardioides sp.]|nr:molybdopterin-dependent oxidoreductase [Nocardioides sp.]